jgi:hypothetical protein
VKITLAPIRPTRWEITMQTSLVSH